MLTRFFEINNYRGQLSLPEIDALFPEDTQVKELKTVMKLLTDLESVTEALQNDSVTLAEAHRLFDKDIHLYPSLECRPEARVPIEENMCFEEAVIKIQAKLESDLTRAERPSVRGVTLADTPEVQLAPTHKGATLMAEVLNKMHNQETVTSIKYLGLCFLLATSNICDRVFSKAKYALSDPRRGISPTSFEYQLYLHVNSDYWCIADVHDLLE